MSHDTHQLPNKENKTIISFKNSFWLIIILVFLFVAALNFIQVESAGEGEGHGAAHETTHDIHNAKPGPATPPHSTTPTEPATEETNNAAEEGHK